MVKKHNKNSNIKKIFLASMFASIVLGSIEVEAEESEHFDVYENEGFMDSKVDEDQHDSEKIVLSVNDNLKEDLHIAFDSHYNKDYLSARNSYSNILDKYELSDELYITLESLVLMTESENEISLDNIQYSKINNNEWTVEFDKDLNNLLKEILNEAELKKFSVENKFNDNELNQDIEKDSLDSSENNAEENNVYDDKDNEIMNTEEKESYNEERTEIKSSESIDQEQLKAEIADEEELNQESKEIEEDKDFDQIDNSSSSNDLEESDVSVFSASSPSKPSESDFMYDLSVNANNASNAWKAAQEFKSEFSDDPRIEDAINQAAHRIYMMGRSNQRSENYSTAIHYYNLILEEPLVDAGIRTDADKFYLQSLEKLQSNESKILFESVLNATNATSAWNNAQTFKKSFPDDIRTQQAFESAAQRIYRMGISRLGNEDFDNATHYFSLLINEPSVNETLRSQAKHNHNIAVNDREIAYSNNMFNQVINANTASSAWKHAEDFKKAFPNDDRITEAFENAGQRIYRMGINSHKNGNFENAVIYYTLLINEPTVSKVNKETALGLRLLANNHQQYNTPQDMYNNVINASIASKAWENLKLYIDTFPNHEGVEDAVQNAYTRVFNLGRINHTSGNFETAIVYYELIVNESFVDGNSKVAINAHIKQAENNYLFRSTSDYYNDVIEAKNATESWEIAKEGMELFSLDESIIEAFNQAVSRNYSLAQAYHRSKNFNAAIIYYDRIINEANVSKLIRDEAKSYRKQAENNFSFTTASKLYQQSANASTASQAWNASINGLKYFSEDTRFMDLFNQAAQRIYALGVNNHKNGKFSVAGVYYDMLINHDDVALSLRVKAESYKYLATNNLFLTNTIVRNSIYQSSLQEALNKQMSLREKPQMSHNGSWRDATREETLRYIEPKNSLPEDLTDLTSQLTTVKIRTEVLNVRTGPGTNFERIATVLRGQEFVIVNESNGWYEIALNGSKGWISGQSSLVERDNGILQFLILSGTSGISISDLNRELESSGILSGHGATFRRASQEANINELYLISHAILETGRGTSNLSTGILVNSVNGVQVAPRIVYNMFGIGAVDHAPDRLGAERAYQLGWFTPEASIIGGAQWISSSYINHPTYKQDTLYKMRWNPSSPGVHQYATDVGWALKQTNSLNSIVHLSQKYDVILNFDIPSYK